MDLAMKEQNDQTIKRQKLEIEDLRSQVVHGPVPVDVPTSRFNAGSDSVGTKPHAARRDPAVATGSWGASGDGAMLDGHGGDAFPLGCFPTIPVPFGKATGLSGSATGEVPVRENQPFAASSSAVASTAAESKWGGVPQQITDAAQLFFSKGGAEEGLRRIRGAGERVAGARVEGCARDAMHEEDTPDDMDVGEVAVGELRSGGWGVDGGGAGDALSTSRSLSAVARGRGVLAADAADGVEAGGVSPQPSTLDPQPSTLTSQTLNPQLFEESTLVAEYPGISGQ